MKFRFLLILILFFFSRSVNALEKPTFIPQPEEDSIPEQLIVSLVTCAPGPDVYALCGHEAIRIRSEKMDSVWNYGIFDFDSPNFIYRFCKGETDYIVRGYDFRWFMPEYVRRGSTVSEQILNLTQEEARDLRKRLQTEALPENRVYRYNYVRDNCATRPWARVTESTARDIQLPDTTYFNSFRDEMRFFHRKYPWYQFGIDLVLGSGLDFTLSPGQDMFAPPVMAKKVGETTIGGEPLVKATNIIFQGLPDATDPPTPWYLTPMAVGIAMFLLSAYALWIAWKKHRLLKWWIFTYFLVAGIAGCMVTFLVFCSEHEATSPNILIFWLNPFQLLIPLFMWWKKTRIVTKVMAWYNICMVLILTAAWPLQPQCANPAIWPMLWSALLLSISCLLTLGLLKKKETKV